MSPARVSAESTNDCDITYEKITSSNYGRISPDCSSCLSVMRNRNCLCNLAGSGYPDYAAEELALFHKLKAETTIHPASIAISGNDELASSSSPAEDLDSEDWDVILIDNINSSDSAEDSAAYPVEKATPENLSLSDKTAGESDGCRYSKPDNEDQSKIALGSKTSSYNCHICGISLPSKSHLKPHLLEHVKSTRNKAKIYKESIVALQKLDYRERVKRSKFRVVCVVCKETFVSRYDLKNHTNLSHAHGRTYKCEICPKNYKTRSHLTRHQLTHWDKF